MPDRNAIADEIERLHKAASPAPWAPRPGVERERTRGSFWSTCKGFTPKPVGQMAGQETATEREANMLLACFLRSHVPEIIAALRAQDREGAGEMRERAYEAVCAVRHAAACNFSPEFSGALGVARTDSLADAAKAVRSLPLSPVRTEDGDA